MRTILLRGERTLWAINVPPIWFVFVIELALFGAALQAITVPLGWGVAVAIAVVPMCIHFVRIGLRDGRVTLLRLYGVVPLRWRSYAAPVAASAFGADAPEDADKLEIGDTEFMCARGAEVVSWLDEHGARARDGRTRPA